MFGNVNKNLVMRPKLMPLSIFGPIIILVMNFAIYGVFLNLITSGYPNPNTQTEWPAYLMQNGQLAAPIFQAISTILLVGVLALFGYNLCTILFKFDWKISVDDLSSDIVYLAISMLVALVAFVILWNQSIAINLLTIAVIALLVAHPACRLYNHLTIRGGRIGDENRY